MAIDFNSTPLTGQSSLYYIDALLDQGPDWNWFNPAANTLYFTFSVTAGNEAKQSGQVAFTASQQSYARQAMSYLHQVTGINFVETSDGNGAQIHLCNVDIASSNTVGLCSWNASWNTDGTGYDADAYVYLDNKEWAVQNASLLPGTEGYETLLHELGHALGLKHPFDTYGDSTVTLPAAEDSTLYTVMSYTESGGPYSQYRAYDMAALMWLYGGDGLAGNLGVNGRGEYILGTAAANVMAGGSGNDMLVGGDGNDDITGNGGNDTIDGGNGTDTVHFAGVRSAYTINSSNGALIVSGSTTGTDTITNVESFAFADMTLAVSQLVDLTPPAAPSATTREGPSGLIAGNVAIISGVTEAKAAIKVLNGTTTLGNATADANGAYTVSTSALVNGSYTLSVIATDAAGNASAPTQLALKVDTAQSKLGTAGADQFTATAGNNTFDGAAGMDTVVFGAAHTAYSVAAISGGFTVTDNAGNGGVDAVFNVERLSFTDHAVIGLDIAGTAGMGYRIYQAAFDRTPDLAGLGYWIGVMDQGASLDSIAAGFLGSAEAQQIYHDTTNAQFVDLLYQHVLHRAGDAGGVTYWNGVLDAGGPRAVVLADFSESPENQAAVIGAIQNGILFTPYP
ncbi:MAG: DUF4214 domain-containing protein [Telluria sp.]